MRYTVTNFAIDLVEFMLVAIACIAIMGFVVGVWA